MRDDEITRHNQIYQRAYDLLRSEIIIDGQPLSLKPNFFVRRRLRKAIALFEQVLEMNPHNWAAMFGMAKALQRLGDLTLAFDIMRKAHDGDPSMSGFARESGLIAIQLGRFSEGIALTEAAIRTRPGDGGLYSNLGLGHLLQGDAREAVEAFQRANELEPSHALTTRLLAVALAVQTGDLPCPRSEADVLRAARKIGGPQ
jgi:tetratricopeptide (TPR) repeat protein